MPTGTPVGKAMYVQPVPLGDPLADASNAPPFQMLTVCGPVSAATLYHQMPLSRPLQLTSIRWPVTTGCAGPIAT